MVGEGKMQDFLRFTKKEEKLLAYFSFYLTVVHRLNIRHI